MFRVMQSAGEAGGMTLVHAENGIAIQQMIENLVAAGKIEPKYHAQSRPPVMQADGVARALRVGEVAKAPVFIVHVSCEAAMNEIVRSRDEGNASFGETCTQYLFLDETCYDKPNFEGAKYVFTPPLVGEGEHRAAVEGSEARLPAGSLDRPLPLQFQGPERARPRGFPQDPQRRAGRRGSAVAGLRRRDEARVLAEQMGRHLLDRVGEDVRHVPEEGHDRRRLRCGHRHLRSRTSSARISAKTHHMNCDYSLFEGWRIKGKPETVLSRGKVIIENNQYKGKPGEGKFLKRGQCATA